MKNIIAQVDFNVLEKGIGFKGGKEPSTIGDLLGRLIPYIFAGAGIALLVYLIMGGFNLMFSGGDPKKIEAGRQTIANALIGFVIVFVAYWLVQILGLILGLGGVGEVFK